MSAFDGIDFGDPAQALGGNLRTIAVENLLQLAPCVRPAMGHPNGIAALARGFGQPVVARIAINLQDTVEAGQEGFGILARAAGSIEVDHSGRIVSAPWPVIAGQRPEISGLCRPAPRSRTGAVVSSMNSLPDRFRCSASRSTTGLRWKAALPTQSAVRHGADRGLPARGSGSGDIMGEQAPAVDAVYLVVAEHHGQSARMGQPHAPARQARAVPSIKLGVQLGSNPQTGVYPPHVANLYSAQYLSSFHEIKFPCFG